MTFKIAYGAGHYLYEAGNRIPAELDRQQTREWVLNDRIARYFAEAAQQYEGVALLRTDDPTGQTETGLQARCNKANGFDADFALSIHHNAGANLTNAGGLVAFSYYSSAEGARYRDAIYEACIAAGGLRGDRWQPKTTAGFHVLKYTYMPCVLMEYGFMDSLADVSTILDEQYAKKMAYATMEAIAQVADLKKKAAQDVQPGESYTLEQFVREVQAACGAVVDGIAGPETIGKTVTVSMTVNDTHPVVKPVQKRLAALGYTQVGNADGIAGPKFQRAVLQFQAGNDCWTDGEITAGNKTWRKLLGME